MSSITMCPVADTNSTHVGLPANLDSIWSQLALTCPKVELCALQLLFHIKGNSPSLPSWPVQLKSLCLSFAALCLCEPSRNVSVIPEVIAL